MTPLWQRVAVRLLGGHLPIARRDELIGDLTEDFARQCQALGHLRASFWLAREVLSLRRAYRQTGHGGGARWLAALRADAVHASRFVVREFLFVASAALTLAVGMSGLAVTTGFASAILFKHITPIAPDRVFVVTATASDQGRAGLVFSTPEVDALRRRLDQSALVTSVSLQSALVRTNDASTQTLAEVVSGPFFRVLPVRPTAGRLLIDSDEDPGSPPVIVISEPLRQRLYGESRTGLGSSLSLNGASFTIVGIVPAANAVSFAAARIDIWVPLEHAAALLNADFRTNAVRRPFMLVGRLRDGVTRAQVLATLTSATPGFAREFAGRRDQRLTAVDSRATVGSQLGAAQIVSGLLAALTLLVIVVVAANVGGLFMARATMRLRPAAVSMSLGAPRAIVVRSILLEGAIVGLVAGAASLGAYAWVRHLLESISVLPTLTLRLDLPFDLAAGALLIAASIVAGIALSLAPAWMTARIDLIQTLRASSGPIWGSVKSARMRRALLAAQVASSLVLVVLAAQFTRGLETLRNVDLGVDMDHLAIVDLDREPSAPPERLPVLAAQTLETIRTIPGVVGAVMSTGAPVNANLAVIQVVSSGQTVGGTTVAQVTPGYFDVVGIRLEEGRAFEDTDLAGGVAVVNDVLARRLNPAGSVVGTDIEVEPGRHARIVGVARNAHYRAVFESPQPHVYTLAAPRFNRSILVRTVGDPRPILPLMQRALDGVGPGVQGFFPRTGRDHLTFDLLPTELAGSAARMISAAAVALSTVGLYGLVSWLVERRRPELGVRIALGAERRDIRRLVFRLAGRSVAPGLVLGAVFAIGLGRLAGTQVVGVSLFDPISLVVGAMVLALVVFVASWLPAQRAARIDPVTLLRQT